MIAEIHQLKPKAGPTTWMCSSCGIDAACNCGAPLMSKAQRAAEAIAANPLRSDRDIAKEIGASPTTVGQARSELSTTGQLEDGPRIGLDGKQRRMPRHEEAKPEPPRKREAFLVFSNEAMLLASYEGPVDEEIIEAAKATASAWCRLVETMEGERQ